MPKQLLRGSQPAFALTGLAALPSDVRWRLRPTVPLHSHFLGLRPKRGRSPDLIHRTLGRSETVRTSGGRAEEIFRVVQSLIRPYFTAGTGIAAI